MRHSIITIIAILVVTAASQALTPEDITLSYTPEEYPESAQYLNNPYQGFYQIHGYSLKDVGGYVSPFHVPHIPEQSAEPSGERLVQLQFNLSAFRDRPISDYALSQLDIILSAWSRTSYSFILRFVYDWNGNAAKTEPEDIDVILQHMEQTAQIYNKYADRIFLIQGLFTGNNGEMHHTHFGSEKDIKLLASKLAETADSRIYLSVRTPNHWRTITGADSYEELAGLSDNPFLDRLGLFNDGMFGSDSDTGTYTERTRAEELAFQDSLCRTVPNGGEAIIDNPFNDFENVVPDMRQMHISYLNSVYDPAVLDKWKAAVYHGSDVFDGCSGYDYIKCHLGYRYVLRSSALRYDGLAGCPAYLALSIENAGFSESYRSFSFLLTLINRDTKERFTVTPDCDSRSLTAGRTTDLSVPFYPAEYPAGTYDLYWLTTDDASGEQILYGNELTLTEDGYLLGTLICDRPQQ